MKQTNGNICDITHILTLSYKIAYNAMSKFCGSKFKDPCGLQML